MENGRTGWSATMVVALVVGGAAPAVTAQAPAVDAMFSAEVSVQRAVVDARGRVTRELPGAKYLLERRADGRLRLTMRPTRATPASGPLADPYAGVVVDQDEQGRLVVTGPDGKPLPGVPLMPGVLPGANRDDDALVAATADLRRRRAQITEAFGPRAGAVRGLDRYVVKTGETVQEVLVSPASALPVEVNVLTKGALTGRHEFSYEPLPDGRLVRARTRSEVVAGTTGERLVSVTTLSGVRVAEGAR